MVFGARVLHAGGGSTSASPTRSASSRPVEAAVLHLGVAPVQAEAQPPRALQHSHGPRTLGRHRRDGRDLGQLVIALDAPDLLDEVLGGHPTSFVARQEGTRTWMCSPSLAGLEPRASRMPRMR